MKKIIAFICLNSMCALLSCETTDSQSAQPPLQQSVEAQDFLYRPVRLDSVFVQAALPTMYITQNENGEFLCGLMRDMGLRDSDRQAITLFSISEMRVLQQRYHAACEKVDHDEKLLDATRQEYKTTTSFQRKISLCYQQIVQSREIVKSSNAKNGLIKDIWTCIYESNNSECAPLAHMIEKDLLKRNNLMEAAPLKESKFFSVIQHHPALKQAQEISKSHLYKNVLFHDPLTVIWFYQPDCEAFENIRNLIKKKMASMRNLDCMVVQQSDTQEPALPMTTNIWVHRDVDLKKLSQVLKIGVELLSPRS